MYSRDDRPDRLDDGIRAQLTHRGDTLWDVTVFASSVGARGKTKEQR